MMEDGAGGWEKEGGDDGRGAADLLKASDSDSDSVQVER